jgi:hypothetical protein
MNFVKSHCLAVFLSAAMVLSAGCGMGEPAAVQHSDADLDARAIEQAKNAKVAAKLKNGASVEYDAMASRSIVSVSKDESGKVSYKVRRKKPEEP